MNWVEYSDNELGRVQLNWVKYRELNWVKYRDHELGKVQKP